MIEAVARIRRGRWSNRTRRGLAVALVWVAVLAAPRGAAAQASFFWTGPSGGNWNDAANWLHANGPVGPGYPSQPADTANFIDDLNGRLTLDRMSRG